jgi:diphthine-ammonia ligase
MKVAVLFSGGKDSVYAAWLARKQGHEISCLISIVSDNPHSYMFHTPNIDKVKSQAKVMNIPLVSQRTKGEKEEELKDLERAIRIVKEDYGIQGIVTGAIQSVYQSSRIQKICDKLKLNCINPLWQKEELDYLYDLVDDNFKVVIVGVFAYPFDEKWLGRKIDLDFIREIRKLNEKYKIHVAGEGGEFETFVLNCPMFSRPIKVKGGKVITEGKYSHRLNLEVE